MSDPAFETAAELAGSVAGKVEEGRCEGWSEGFKKGCVLTTLAGGAWVGATFTAEKTSS